MATKQSNTRTFKKRPSIKRRGIHSKKKSSSNKNSKNYLKRYRGQG